MCSLLFFFTSFHQRPSNNFDFHFEANEFLFFSCILMLKYGHFKRSCFSSKVFDFVWYLVINRIFYELICTLSLIIVDAQMYSNTNIISIKTNNNIQNKWRTVLFHTAAIYNSFFDVARNVGENKKFIKVN